MGTTSNAVKDRWNAAHYDKISITVPKGDRDKISDYAAALGLSRNEFITGLIYRAMSEKLEQPT